MSLTKYATGYGDKIEAVEVVRETDSCVFFLGGSGREQRRLKRTDYLSYHDTWKDAHAYLVQRGTEGVDSAVLGIASAKRRLEAAQAALATVLAMTPPATAPAQPDAAAEAGEDVTP